jgi:hypothetical protein
LAPWAGPLHAAGGEDKAAQMAKIERFLGVYQAVPLRTALPGGLRGAGDLRDLPLTPTAMEQQKKVDLKWDAAKNCRIVGPVRMMAREDTRFELAPTLTGGLYMIYKNANLGSRRDFEFGKQAAADAKPFWVGHSVAHWKDADTFVVETTGYNGLTWLNDAGAPHSDALTTVEEYHLLPSGDLRLTMMVTDAKTLARPFPYVRYFARQGGVLGEVFCEEEMRQNP